MTDVIVKESKINKKGVFADRDFKKGEIIVKWNPKELTKEEFENLSEEESHYAHLIDGQYLLQRSPGRYVNHSCDANTEFGEFCDVAIRDIKKGEEITSDYEKELMPEEVINCNCGSKNCRGIIYCGIKEE